MVNPTIVNSVKNYLHEVSKSGIPVSFGVIFGSYAVGNPDEFSDIDLLVVSPRFDGIIPREAVNKLWHIAARTDSRIEPVPCGQIQWQDDVTSAIIEIARTQGQTVSAA